jgi:hypothetical protein
LVTLKACGATAESHQDDQQKKKHEELLFGHNKVLLFKKFDAQFLHIVLSGALVSVIPCPKACLKHSERT